jgi:hypothetical protein
MFLILPLFYPFFYRKKGGGFTGEQAPPLVKSIENGVGSFLFEGREKKLLAPPPYFLFI